jgi:hypothetical protein
MTFGPSLRLLPHEWSLEVMALLRQLLPPELFDRGEALVGTQPGLV